MRLLLLRPMPELSMDRAKDAWRWWLAELAGMAPPALRAYLAPSRPGLVLAFTGDGIELHHSRSGAETPCGRIEASALEGPVPAALATALADPPSPRIELRLPAAQALRQRLVLPLAGAGRITTLLAFELDRQTPFTAQQVYLAARIAERRKAAKRMAVEVLLVKRRSADTALDQLRKWGLDPERVTVEGEPGWPLDFLPEPASARALLGRHRVTVALAALATVLGLAAGYAHVSAGAGYAEALADELARSRATAEQAKTVQKEVDALAAKLAFLAQRKQAVGAARLLEELAERLPDDSWVTQFELKGKAMRIQGLSGAAAAALGKLGESGMLTGLRFTAPPVQAKPGSERFEIAGELRDGGAP